MDFWLPDTSGPKKPKRKKSSRIGLPLIVGAILLLIISIALFMSLQFVNSPSAITTSPPNTAIINVGDANATALAAQSITTPALSTSVLIPTSIPAIPLSHATQTLPQGDLDLLALINAKTSAANSMRFDFNITLAATAPSEAAEINIAGSGHFTGLDDFNTFRGQLIVPNGTITLPDGSTGHYNFELRFLEGSLYFYVQASSPRTDCTATRWIQITLQDLLTSVTLLSPATGIDLFTESFDPSDLTLSEADEQAFEDILDLISLSRYLQITRLPDAGVTGTFAYHLDLPGFLQSDEFFTFLGSFGQFGGPTFNPEQLNQGKAMVQMLLPQILTNFSLTAYQEFDSVRQLNTGYRIDLETDLNLAGAIENNSTPPVHLGFDFQVGLSEHGTLFPLEKPTDSLRLNGLPMNGVLPPEAFAPCAS